MYIKASLATFNQKKALVGAFSVITNLRMELFEATDELWPLLTHLNTQLCGLLAASSSSTHPRMSASSWSSSCAASDSWGSAGAAAAGSAAGEASSRKSSRGWPTLAR